MLLVSGVGIRLLLFEKTSGYPQMGRVRARVMSSTKSAYFRKFAFFLEAMLTVCGCNINVAENVSVSGCPGVRSFESCTCEGLCECVVGWCGFEFFCNGVGSAAFIASSIRCWGFWWCFFMEAAGQCDTFAW